MKELIKKLIFEEILKGNGEKKGDFFMEWG